MSVSWQKTDEFRIEDGMIMEYYGTGGLVDIPLGVQDIFFEVFCGMEAITEVHIPGSVSDLTPLAFDRCSGLVTARLDAGITEIGCAAFNDCTALSKVVFPKTLKTIHPYAFSNCRSLSQICFRGSREEWEAVEKGADWDKDTGKYRVLFEAEKDETMGNRTTF